MIGKCWYVLIVASVLCALISGNMSWYIYLLSCDQLGEVRRMCKSRSWTYRRLLWMVLCCHTTWYLGKRCNRHASPPFFGFPKRKMDVHAEITLPAGGWSTLQGQWSYVANMYLHVIVLIMWLFSCWLFMFPCWLEIKYLPAVILHGWWIGMTITRFGAIVVSNCVMFDVFHWFNHRNRS